MLGHAEGRPMTEAEIASELNMPPRSVNNRLKALRKLGTIRRIDDRYYLDPDRAKNVPHLDAINLILMRAYAVLSRHLAEVANLAE
jgi:DNA-binding Lrp family transcriptional regulator